MDKVSALHLLRVMLVLVLWACWWNRFAKWLAGKTDTDASKLVKLKYRVLIWMVLFEAVMLIGVKL